MTGLRKVLMREKVLSEIGLERSAQDAKWGEQNHPDGTGAPWDEKLAKSCRIACEKAAEEGRLTWRHILMEEMAEAFAETNHVALRKELVQVAAVAAAWVEAIDRGTDDAS